MYLAGLQKLTLLDYPQHVACTVFTAGCNLRCPFCHNSDLVLPDRRPEPLEEDAFFAFLKKRRGILEGVCVTGGEPLLQKDIRSFLRAIKDMGYAVKLDTNGTFPDLLQSLRAEGLVDFVAMDIKNSPARYAETCGLAAMDLTPIRRSAEFLLPPLLCAMMNASTSCMVIVLQRASSLRRLWYLANALRSRSYAAAVFSL